MQTVQSFDFWDTLVARECIRPIDIFYYMMVENNLPKDFQTQRIYAERRSDGSFDCTYEVLQKHYNWSIEYTNYVKQLEIITEIKYIIPVQENIQRVRDGDIIVSDMYLPEKAFRDILNFIGFAKKDVKIFITTGGKCNGTIWEGLLNKYNITLHLGDNPLSDVESPNKFNIKSELTTITQFTKAEQYFIDTEGFNNIGHTLRRLRLDVPFDSKDEKNLWFDMMNHIIPVFVFFCIYICKIAKEKGLTKIRFITRDNKLYQRIFEKLFPFYNTNSFISSRYLNKSDDASYKKYVIENYDNATLLVDLNGSFRTGRSLFLELFGKLPNIVLFCYDETWPNPIFSTMSYLFQRKDLNYTFSYEYYVQSYGGKNLGLRQSGTAIRNINEYKHGYVAQRAIDSFVDSISFNCDKFSLVDFKWLKGFINSTYLLSLDFLKYEDRPDSTILINKPILPAQYYPQIGQDKCFIEHINNGKQNGCFVDVGVHNGITSSNTNALEKLLNCKGLCIEVDDTSFDKLGAVSSSTCINECVFSEMGIEKEIEVPIANDIPEYNDLLIRIKDSYLSKRTGFI
jgi:hypothetical protein